MVRRSIEPTPIEASCSASSIVRSPVPFLPLPAPTPRGREMQRDLSNGLTDREPDFADNQIQSMATPTGETFTFAYDASKKTVSGHRAGANALILGPPAQLKTTTASPSGREPHEPLGRAPTAHPVTEPQHGSPSWRTSPLRGHAKNNVSEYDRKYSYRPYLMEFSAGGFLRTADYGDPFFCMHARFFRKTVASRPCNESGEIKAEPDSCKLKRLKQTFFNAIPCMIAASAAAIEQAYRSPRCSSELTWRIGIPIANKIRLNINTPLRPHPPLFVFNFDCGDVSFPGGVLAEILPGLPDQFFLNCNR